MNRDLVINVLLIIAGIVLAIALFGAGVMWKSRTAPRTTSIVLGGAHTVMSSCWSVRIDSFEIAARAA